MDRTSTNSSNSTAKQKQQAAKPVFKMPEGGIHADDIASLISFVSEEANRLASAFSVAMPKVNQFVRKNWRPVAAVATLGLTAYGLYKVRQPRRSASGSKKKRKLH